MAVYARFSSDLQDARSIDDQAALCRGFAERQGWQVVEVYPDHAVSGSSVHGRFAFERMVADARRGAFDVILAEDLDRLSRNQADIAALHQRMAFVGIALHTVADGAIGEMHIGLKGTMSALFLKTLALKTHRGLQGRVRAGKSAGGRCYGYRVTAVGEREVLADEADIVRRIFAETITGRSPREIAGRLNRESVPSPRGGKWNASTIHGHKARGTGILRNELYAGRLVWNRQRFVRDPDTGRRVSRPNTVEDIMRVEVSALRIVSDVEWTAVQERLAAAEIGPHRSHRRARHLLSGLIRCGACGGSYIVAGGKPGHPRFACSTRRESATCDNRRIVSARLLEDRILSALERELLHEDVIAAAVAAYVEARRRASRGRDARRAGIERRLGEIGRALKRAAAAVMAGETHRALFDGMREMEAEEDALRAELAALGEETVVRLHPGIAERYRGLVQDLRGKLAATDGDTRDEAIAAIRTLIEAVVVYPRDDAKGRDLELTGQLAALLQPDSLAAMGMGKVVAGVGFEPTTFRL